MKNTHRHAHSIKQLLFGVKVLFFRKVLSITQAFTPGNYGHLLEREMLDITIYQSNRILIALRRGSAC